VRVLYHIQGNVFGGAHNQCLRLHGELAQQGYDSVVLLPDDPGNAAERLSGAGVEVHQRKLARIRAGKSPAALARQVVALRRQAAELADFLVRERIDLVQVHGLLALDAAVAARRVGIPLVWQLIDTRPPTLLRRALVPLVNRWADAIMTTGTRLLAEYPGLASDPERHVPFFPPVASGEFAAEVPPDTRQRVRRALLGRDVDPDTVLVGSLGNLNPQKGFEYLIDAVASLRKAGRNVELVIRGAESPGHPWYRASLTALLERHGLPATTVAPLEPDIPVAEFMSALDLFALTPVRRSEGVPTVLLEAMWAGRPCVAADVGGVREVVTTAVGAMCRPEEPDSAAAAIAQVIDAGESGRSAMSRAARLQAEILFTLQECTKAHVAAYDLARRHHEAAQPARGAQ
jgi:glycosyltransferase involved in cell wall biosynthesis